MIDYITGMKFSAFFLLACGAVVKQAEALAGLKAVAERYFVSILIGSFSHQSPRLKFTDSFAFGAEHLISHQVATWMMSYADQVIVGGQPSKDAIGNLLYSSGVGKHTSIVFINGTTSKKEKVTSGKEKATSNKGKATSKKEKATSNKGEATSDEVKQEYQVSQYIWEHNSHRPNTHSFPIACPLCHYVYPWRSIPGHVTDEGTGFDLRCKTVLADGGKCMGTWKVAARPMSSTVPSPNVGTWRVM